MVENAVKAFGTDKVLAGHVFAVSVAFFQREDSLIRHFWACAKDIVHALTRLGLLQTAAAYIMQAFNILIRFTLALAHGTQG